MKTVQNILMITILSLPLVAHAAVATTDTKSADEILKEVEKRITAKDESAKVVMTIQEANGSTKTRELEIMRKSADQANKVMVKLDSPADLRGTALLSVGGKNKVEDQWLYLPSNKQTRRIISSNKSSSFLDSEMNYEDMGSSADKTFSNKIAKTDTGAQGPETVIESTLTSGNSTYSKMLTTISTKDYLVSKIEYFDKKGALLKTTEMADYKKFPGDVWRAQSITVKNAQNHRGTTLQLKDLKVNQGLPDSDFSESSMAEES